MTQAIPLTPWKRANYLESSNGNLTMNGVDLVALATRTGSPHYVYSERKIRANSSAMLTALRRVHPKTSIAYASKAMANMSVLRIIKDEGLDVEVNSGGELFKVLEAGFTGDQIVFNGVAKTEAEIEAAIDANIKAINIDSLDELDRVINCARTSQFPANIALRVIPEIKGGGTAGLETGSTSSKFGMTRDEITDALEKVRGASNAVSLKGFHAHIGSQVNNLGAYRAEAAFMIEFLKQIKDLLPYPLQHLNLGGGFPISYIGKTNANKSPNHLAETYTAAITNDDVAAALIAPIRECFGSDLELIVEPGRSIIADTAVLMTRVEAIKARPGPRWLYLDAGYGIMLDAVFGWYFHMITANRADDNETAPFRVFGPLCDSYDAFYDVSGEAAIASLLQQAPALASHRDLLDKVLLHQPGFKELPTSTSVGDLVAVFDVGAYNIDTQSQYCGRLQPSVSLITMDGTIREIRRAETLDDLVARD